MRDDDGEATLRPYPFEKHQQTRHELALRQRLVDDGVPELNAGKEKIQKWQQRRAEHLRLVRFLLLQEVAFRACSCVAVVLVARAADPATTPTPPPLTAECLVAITTTTTTIPKKIHIIIITGKFNVVIINVIVVFVIRVVQGSQGGGGGGGGGGGRDLVAACGGGGGGGGGVWACIAACVTWCIDTEAETLHAPPPIALVFRGEGEGGGAGLATPLGENGRA